MIKINDLREFDGGGSGDDAVAEELRDERKKTIFLRELAVAQRFERTVEVHP